MPTLTHIDLFSGIGGFALAARWAGFQTVCFSEVDPYASAVLRKHWPIVPNLGDIKTADFGPYAGATLLTGGFPCQPFSVAGKRAGASDDRFLWPRMLEVIAAVQPTWIVGENVAGIIRMELDRVLSDLEAKNYSCLPFVVPACAVDARHRRDRVWIVAHANGSQRRPSQHGAGGTEPRQDSRREEAAGVAGIGRQVLANAKSMRPQAGGAEIWNESGQPEPGRSGAHVSDANILRGGEEPRALPGTQGPPESNEGGRGRTEPGNCCQVAADPMLAGSLSATQSAIHRGEAGAGARNEQPQRLCRWPIEPNVGRVANGIPRRVDRIKGLGNAIVPQVAFQILQAIKDLETS